jgi:cell division protein FtsB
VETMCIWLSIATILIAICLSFISYIAAKSYARLSLMDSELCTLRDDITRLKAYVAILERKVESNRHDALEGLKYLQQSIEKLKK